MSRKYIIAKNVMAEYDTYVIEQKIKQEDHEEVDILNFKDRLEYKLIQEKVTKTKTTSQSPSVEKRKFLDFVYLTQDEYTILIKEYGDKHIKNVMVRLNDYIGSKGDKYKSHYYVILTWLRNSGIKKLTPKEHVSVAQYKPQTQEEKKKTQEVLQKARNLLI